MHLIKDLACSAQDPCAHSRLLWIHPQASPRESAGGKLGIKGNRAAQAHASSLCHSMSLYLTLLGEHPSPHLWSASSDSKDCIYFIPHKTSSLFVGHRNRDFRAKMSCYDSRVLSAREHRLSANHWRSLRNALNSDLETSSNGKLTTSFLVIAKTEHYFHFEFVWLQLPATRCSLSVCQFEEPSVLEISLPFWILIFSTRPIGTLPKNILRVLNSWHSLDFVVQ